MPASPFISFNSGSCRRSKPARVAFLTTPIMSLLAAGVLFGTIGSVALTGCSISTNEAAQLPTLSRTAQLREDIVGADLAIEEAAVAAAQLAVLCPECADTLQQGGDAAEQRVDLAGGQWQPWDDTSADLPRPPTPAGAPSDPHLLVSYMYQSAQKQLQEIAETSGLEQDQRVLLASLVAGRAASAFTLSQTYPTSNLGALPGAALEPTKTDKFSYSDYALKQGGDAPSSKGSSEQDAPTGADETGGSVDDTLTQDALVSYDCIATGFSKLFDGAGQEQDNSLFFNRFTDRSAALEQDGVSDKRPVRCTLPLIDENGDTAKNLRILMEKTVGTDLSLMKSSSVKIRTLAAEFLIDDIKLWSKYQEANQVTPGLVEKRGQQSGK